MTEPTMRSTMAYHLVRQASALLNMAERFNGDQPSMHPNAEFQALDLMQIEFNRTIEVMRKAFKPYEVEQKS